MGDVWTTDPQAASRNRKHDWPTIVAKVVDRPGEYLLVDDNASNSMASYINRVGLRAFAEHPQYKFDAITTNTHGPARNRCHLHLRATLRED